MLRPRLLFASFTLLAPGESREVELEIPYRQFGLWDKDLHFSTEEGRFQVWLGRNANEKIQESRIRL